MVRDSFLKCQRHGGTYLGGLTEDIWILSSPGPIKGDESSPDKAMVASGPSASKPLPSQAAHLLSPPCSSQRTKPRACFPQQLSAPSTGSRTPQRALAPGLAPERTDPYAPALEGLAPQPEH